MTDLSWQAMLQGLMMGVLPWGFVLAGAWLIYRTHRFLKGAARVRGVVVEVHEKSRRSGGDTTRRVTTYRPVFEYTDAKGTPRRAPTFLYSTSYNFQIGQVHDILANPDMPQTVRLPGWMNYGFGGLFVGLGLLFGIAGLFAMRAI